MSAVTLTALDHMGGMVLGITVSGKYARVASHARGITVLLVSVIRSKIPISSSRRS